MTEAEIRQLIAKYEAELQKTNNLSQRIQGALAVLQEQLKMLADKDKVGQAE